MASINDWNKYINLLHDLAYVEDDLRKAHAVSNGSDSYDAGVQWLAGTILFERFGVDV